MRKRCWLQQSPYNDCGTHCRDSSRDAMGAKCATLSKDEGDDGTKESAVAMSKDTKFWHEKMCFSQSSQSLFDASVRGDSELAAQSLRGLADPNCCNHLGYRPLQVAISCGNLHLIETLLKAGADINGHSLGSPPPLVLAAGTGDLRVFELLLDRGADLAIADQATTESALTRAASRGHYGIVNAALSQGSHGFQKLLAQRTRSSDGATALHLAAAGGHLKVCDRLLGVGADPSAPEKRGRTPLHGATSSNHLETANLLLTFGAAASVGDNEGQAPLHIAAAAGLLAMADLLLRYGANVNAARRDGLTPVHLAAWAGHDVVVRLLLSQAAEPNVESKAGDTPFARAFREGHVKCCRALLEGGAEVKAIAPDVGWMPPYTEFEVEEHASLRAGRKRDLSKAGPEVTDDTSRDLIGC